jgi:hypothetical protein
MRFAYYLAAIGHRGLDVKLNILAKNLNYLYSQLNSNFDIIINCYNSEDVVFNFVQQFTFLNTKLFHNKPGVLTELFLTNPHNASLSNYDYILFMLDDVEIQELNLREMINLKEKYKIELLSPKVINSTHSFMNSYPEQTLTINNALEVYCLLLKYKDFQRFLSIHTVENKWMWGADFLFGYFNIKAGVYHKSSVKHMLLPSKKNTNNAAKLMNVYLRQVNFYGSIADIVAVKNVINLRTGKSTKPVNYDDNHHAGTSGKLMRVNFNKSSPNSSPSSSPTNMSSKRLRLNDSDVIKLLGKVNKYRKAVTSVNKKNMIIYNRKTKKIVLEKVIIRVKTV